MAHRTGAGGTRRNTLRGVAVVVVAVVGTLVGPVAAQAESSVATLTLQPVSGYADTSITATFHLQPADGDDTRDCELKTSFWWDGYLLNTHFTNACTSHDSFQPPLGARGAGAHQVSAEDLRSGARATAVFTIVTPAHAQPTGAGTTGTTGAAGKGGGVTGRTMANGPTGQQDGGEMAMEPSASAAPASSPPAYRGAAGIPAKTFPLSSWIIGSSVAILVTGALVIFLTFPQLPPHQARHGPAGPWSARLGDGARLLTKRWNPNRWTRRRGPPAGPGGPPDALAPDIP